VQGAVGDGVVDVDDELRVGRQLVPEQRLDAARRVEQLAVLGDARQLGQRTCHVRHHLPRSHRRAPSATARRRRSRSDRPRYYRAHASSTPPPLQSRAGLGRASPR